MSKVKQLFHSQLFWIQVCAAGIWLLVYQNYFGSGDTAQKVYVVGGNIDAKVSGRVNVADTLNVNVSAINGSTSAFYGPAKDGAYDAIHVYTGW